MPNDNMSLSRFIFSSIDMGNSYAKKFYMVALKSFGTGLSGQKFSLECRCQFGLAPNFDAASLNGQFPKLFQVDAF